MTVRRGERFLARARGRRARDAGVDLGAREQSRDISEHVARPVRTRADEAPRARLDASALEHGVARTVRRPGGVARCWARTAGGVLAQASCRTRSGSSQALGSWLRS